MKENKNCASRSLWKKFLLQMFSKIRINQSVLIFWQQRKHNSGLDISIKIVPKFTPVQLLIAIGVSR